MQGLQKFVDWRADGGRLKASFGAAGLNKALCLTLKGLGLA